MDSEHDQAVGGLKRLAINGAQMSFAVCMGLLLSPVVLSIKHSLHQLFHR